MFQQPFGRWLLADQNGHRPVTTLLLFRADYARLGGQGDLLVAASLACGTRGRVVAVLAVAAASGALLPGLRRMEAALDRRARSSGSGTSRPRDGAWRCWHAVVPGFQASRAYTVWALLPEGACPVARVLGEAPQSALPAPR
jgi:hypothetical protein